MGTIKSHKEHSAAGNKQPRHRASGHQTGARVSRSGKGGDQPTKARRPTTHKHK